MTKRSGKSRSPTQQENRVRIIAGLWKGRKISFPDGAGLRPTGDRTRETLFNWLMPVLPGATCLDIFAGSGALGFEALSRGASHCVLVDNNPEAVRFLQTSAGMLAASGAEIICAGALQWLEGTARQFDIVFLDPPFAESDQLVIDIMAILNRRRLLAVHGWVYLEQSRDCPLPLLSGLQLYREQCSGRVRASLWRSVTSDAP